MRNGTAPFLRHTTDRRLIFILSLPPRSSLLFPLLSPYFAFHRLLFILLLLLFSLGLFYRRASSTFLCFGRQAEVVVTVWFVESVPEVSCSHDDSPEATVPSTTRRLVRAKIGASALAFVHSGNTPRKDRETTLLGNTQRVWVEEARPMTRIGIVVVQELSNLLQYFTIFFKFLLPQWIVHASFYIKQ